MYNGNLFWSRIVKGGVVGGGGGGGGGNGEKPFHQKVNVDRYNILHSGPCIVMFVLFQNFMKVSKFLKFAGSIIFKPSNSKHPNSF